VLDQQHRRLGDGPRAATNSSEQTSTTVYEDGVTYTFASAPTVGITRAGRLQVASAVNITGIAYTAGHR
jgi:hypothetical protein